MQAGKVVGVITWGVNNEREQYNGAKSLDASFNLLSASTTVGFSTVVIPLAI